VPLGKDQIVHADKIIMPDVRNMSLLKAMNTLRKNELRTKINGSGKVIWQSPKPGTKTTAGSICSIGLK
jgi:beta-lactam-binding protein with PASTA domain